MPTASHMGAGGMADTRLLPLLLGWMETFIWVPFVYACLVPMQTCLSIAHKEPSMGGWTPSDSYSRCAQSAEVPSGTDT